MRILHRSGLGLTLFTSSLLAADFAPAPQEFRQEVAQHFTIAPGLPANAAQLLDLAADGTPRVLAGGTWSELRDGQWRALPALAPKSDREFVFANAGGSPVKLALPWTNVNHLVRTDTALRLATATGVFFVRDGRLDSQHWPAKSQVNQLAVSSDGTCFVASSSGIFRRLATRWEALEISDGLGRAWAVSDVLGVAFDTSGRLWFATKAGVGCHTTVGWKFYEGKDGLPWNEFTCVAAGPDGEVWFGTHRGAIRWDGREFHYRQGPRWLPHDDVSAVAVDAKGTAWFATAGGVGSIERRPMTLAAKAEFYEEEIDRHLRRTPFGYVDGARLTTPADKSTASPTDSDNDGLWTAMYGAGECFAYGATKDAKAKARATAAFEALRFLQKVTQGGTPAPPKGYVARTIRPTEGPDPNVGRVAADREKQQADAMWKVYEHRWPKSADGKWYWKSDTSSDELDGHFFFYALYHDLVADTSAEKERVREVVRDLTDHLITHDFSLTDHDGQPTRWGVYGPQSLNGDPRWWAERGLNSLSILTYLAVAEHLTGDAKYAAAARELIDQHGYAQNLMFAKVQAGAGSGNQSDDEMAFMCYYTLLRCSKDAALKNVVRASFYAYWQTEAAERNPFFNFAYAATSIGQSMTNVWGTFPVSPLADWHADSVGALHGFSLDRLNWAHQNSHRLDVVPLDRARAIDFYEPGNEGRGYRVDGKVLPVENRHFGHWNTDPWRLDVGGRGNQLDAGTVFLLPYYLGLYHGFVAKP
ncbi:MAG: hypothetical protein EXS32_14940 [Opitutus sp.]|nr:hypothetical protein [Opitutus sp.]